MHVRERAHLLTNDTLCDLLQLFAERGHGVDGWAFGEHWENTTVVSTKEKLENGPQLIYKKDNKAHVQQTQWATLS